MTAGRHRPLSATLPKAPELLRCLASSVTSARCSTGWRSWEWIRRAKTPWRVAPVGCTRHPFTPPGHTPPGHSAPGETALPTLPAPGWCAPKCDAYVACPPRPSPGRLHDPHRTARPDAPPGGPRGRPGYCTRRSKPPARSRAAWAWRFCAARTTRPASWSSSAGSPRTATPRTAPGGRRPLVPPTSVACSPARPASRHSQRNPRSEPDDAEASSPSQKDARAHRAGPDAALIVCTEVEVAAVTGLLLLFQRSILDVTIDMVRCAQALDGPTPPRPCSRRGNGRPAARRTPDQPGSGW